MNRRSLLLTGIAAAACRDRAWSAVLSLVDLAALGKALGDAAEAVGKLADSIAHLVSLGRQGWDVISARSTLNRLRDISVQLTFLSQSQNARVIESLDDYIMEARRGAAESVLQEAWSNLLLRISATLKDVKSLLDSLKHERSDLVTQNVYQELIATLDARSSLLTRLENSAAPTSPLDLDALGIASSNYKILRDNLRRAIAEINQYIHSLK